MEEIKNPKWESTQKLVEYARQSGNKVMKELADRLKQNTMPDTIGPERSQFAAQSIGEFVNAYGYDADAFAEALMHEHRTTQQQVISLFLRTIRKFAVINPALTDGRNKKAVETCRKIYDFMEENSISDRLPLI